MATKIEERENDIQLGKLNRDDEENYDDREDAGLMADAAARQQAPVPSAKGLTMATVADSKPLSILAYCLSSISMTVVNKYVVSGDEWNLTSLYLAAQSAVCVITILICKQFGLIESLAPLEKEKVKKWLPISTLLVGMIYTGTKALQYLSVPVYTIFKNLTIIVIAYGEVMWFGGFVTRMCLLSFLLMVFSSVVAAWADIQSAFAGEMGSGDSAADLSKITLGYTWMGLNVFCSASYVLGMRLRIKSMNFQDKDTMYYNNLLSIPILIVCSFVTEDWSGENLAKNFPEENRNSILVGIVYSGFMAIFISYCSAWCIRATTSTTYSMVGALNKLPIAISGLIFFSAPVTFGSVSAIIIGFISGLVYAVAKKQEADDKKKATLPK